MDKKTVRGASFVISEELFNDMLSKYLGFEPEALRVWHVTNQHYMRAVEVSITTDDERFPEIPEGSIFPRLSPIVEAVKVSDDPLRYEVRFVGFSEVRQ